MKIALDAMGGDFGPPTLLAARSWHCVNHPQIDRLFLVGDTPQIEAELKKANCNDGRIQIVHSTQVVANDRWRRRFRKEEKGFLGQPRG
jgi:glycerol-3-phosphate acyltransferase PlsX